MTTGEHNAIRKAHLRGDNKIKTDENSEFAGFDPRDLMPSVVEADYDDLRWLDKKWSTKKVVLENVKFCINSRISHIRFLEVGKTYCEAHYFSIVEIDSETKLTTTRYRLANVLSKYTGQIMKQYPGRRFRVDTQLTISNQGINIFVTCVRLEDDLKAFGLALEKGEIKAAEQINDSEDVSTNEDDEL